MSAVMDRTEDWKVFTATVGELEARLNALAREGYEVFSILPVGVPEPLSHVPREHKSLEERTTFAVVARRRAAPS